MVTNSYGQKRYNGNKNIIKIEKENSIILQENLQLLGKINDLAVDKMGNIFLINSQTASIIKYNKEGIQKNILGKKGRGPFEFIKPSNLSINKDTLLIWDKSLLRLSAITTTGDHLLQLTDFSNAVAEIKKYNSYIIAYNTGGGFGPLLTIYDLANKKIAKEVGEKTNEHILLMTLNGSGALTLVDDKVFYSLADQPILKQISLKDFSTNSFNVDIPNFKVEKVEKSPIQVVNNNRDELFDYLSKNSRVSNIFKLDEYIIMEAETGSVKMREKDQYINRKTNLSILDKDLNQIDTITFSNKNFTGSNLKAVHKNSLYNIHQEISDGKLRYVLSIWKINPI